MPSSPRILLCTCSRARVLPPEPLSAVQAAFQQSPREVYEADDLCEWAARRDQRLSEVFQNGPVKIVACHRRAVKWLLAFAGITFDPKVAEVVNLRSLAPEQAVARVLSTNIDSDSENVFAREDDNPASERPPVEAQLAAPVPKSPAREDWSPWFPVIDFDRCTDCMQCLNFCLFGVFGVDAGKRVRVQNPTACKTQCPACSRVCPEAAIIFPKYRSGPISGDVVRGLDVERENMKADLSSLLGGDLYQVLRARTGTGVGRFSPQRDHAQALAERRRHLTALLEGSGLSEEDLKRMVMEQTLPSSPRLNDPSSSLAP